MMYLDEMGAGFLATTQRNGEERLIFLCKRATNLRVPHPPDFL
jgi:hypothetical protein